MICECVRACVCTVHMVCCLSMFKSMLECVQCAEVRGWWPNPLDAQNSSVEGQCIFLSLFLYQALVSGCTSRVGARGEIGLFHSTMSPILALSRTHSDACIWLSQHHSSHHCSVETNSHGIRGVRTKWKKEACTSKSHQAFTAFLPKNFSTLVIVRRYSFPFFFYLWLFLSLLLFISPFAFSAFSIFTDGN